MRVFFFAFDPRLFVEPTKMILWSTGISQKSEYISSGHYKLGCKQSSLDVQ
jgi:hypothetical protein